MSNTKQQIEEMLNKVSEYNKLSGKGHGDLKDNCYICGISPSGLIEAIDRLVTEARKPYIKMLKLYGTPTCDSLHHPKGYYHSALESCPVADRIAELQSQLTNKENK